MKDGEQLQLSATVKGDPEPKVEWLKDGQKVVSSDIVDLKYRSGSATLTIEEAFPEDEGAYECVATNSEGKCTTKCFIKIIRKSFSRCICLIDLFPFMDQQWINQTKLMENKTVHQPLHPNRPEL